MSIQSYGHCAAKDAGRQLCGEGCHLHSEGRVGLLTLKLAFSFVCLGVHMPVPVPGERCAHVCAYTLGGPWRSEVNPQVLFLGRYPSFFISKCFCYTPLTPPNIYISLCLCLCLFVSLSLSEVLWGWGKHVWTTSSVSRSKGNLQKPIHPLLPQYGSRD